MSVEHLMAKAEHGAALQAREHAELDPAHGWLDGVRAPPLRQVLLLSSSTLRAFQLKPGDLRENIVVDWDDLHSLPSGTEIQLGTARLRLTFHCEPCARVARFARPAELLHRRGYLAAVSAAGSVRVGDALTLTGRRFDQVPYEVRDRLAWYLAQRDSPVDTMTLLWELGLSRSYARALPALLRRLAPPLQQKVRFKRDG